MEKNNKKKDGFFCRKAFRTQLALLDTVEQVLELVDAAYAYMDNEQYKITDKVVRMAFVSWKSVFDYEKEKEAIYHKKRKEISDKGNEVKKANRQIKPVQQTTIPTLFESEQQAEATAQPSDGIPYAEIVETYPFEKFWKIYGKIVGHDICQKLWMSIPDETKARIMDHVVKYVESRPDKRTRRDPYNYLIKKTWEDEIISATPINTNNQSASNYGSNNRQSYKEAEFERNARTVIENLQAAERGELAYLSPFNPPSGQR